MLDQLLYWRAKNAKAAITQQLKTRKTTLNGWNYRNSAPLAESIRRIERQNNQGRALYGPAPLYHE
jgi:hypothetical protein